VVLHNSIANLLVYKVTAPKMLEQWNIRLSSTTIHAYLKIVLLYNIQYHLAFGNCRVSLLVTCAFLLVCNAFRVVLTLWLKGKLWCGVRDCIRFFMFRLLLWKNHSSRKANCDVGFTIWLELSKRKAFTKMVNSIIQAERQIVMWGLHCRLKYLKERHSPRW
jgi:hypothetical protein